MLDEIDQIIKNLLIIWKKSKKPKKPWEIGIIINFKLTLFIKSNIIETHHLIKKYQFVTNFILFLFHSTNCLLYSSLSQKNFKSFFKQKNVKLINRISFMIISTITSFSLFLMEKKPVCSFSTLCCFLKDLIKLSAFLFYPLSSLLRVL